MASPTNEGSEKRVIDELDGVLPEAINRRTFFKMAVTTTVGSLAGCIGGGETNTTQTSATPTDNSNPGDSGSQHSPADEILNNVVWRSPWKAEPMYAVSYVSQLNGHWTDKKISPPTVRKGFGSGDTAKRIGTGKEALGMGAITPQVAGFAEGYDMEIYGVGTARSIMALIYRKDSMNSGTDLANKTIVAESALNEQSWPIYTEAVDAPDSVTLEFAEESGAVALLDGKKADAIWGTVDDFGPTNSQTKAELGMAPLYNHAPIYGNTLIVNKSWLQESNNFEYTRRVLEGYSRAGKWTLLNPVKAVDLMRTDVNQALQTIEKEILIDNMRAGTIATNLTTGVKENGFGYLNEEVLSNSYTHIADILGIKAPTVADTANTDLQNKAELATFSSEEWNQITEWARPYSDLFQDP